MKAERLFIGVEMYDLPHTFDFLKQKLPNIVFDTENGGADDPYYNHVQLVISTDDPKNITLAQAEALLNQELAILNDAVNLSIDAITLFPELKRCGENAVCFYVALDLESLPCEDDLGAQARMEAEEAKAKLAAEYKARKKASDFEVEVKYSDIALVLYEVYEPDPQHPHGGDLIATFELKEDAEAWREEQNKPHLIISPVKLSSEEAERYYRDQLPGLDGYYV